MLSCLLVFIVFMSGAWAQYPNLIYDSTATLGQCLTDADCLIYIQQNASLGPLGLFCDATTSRCSLPSGQTFGPAFGSTYTGLCNANIVSFKSILSFPSLAQYTDINTVKANLADGMIIVNMAFTSQTFEGVLRLYFDNNAGSAYFNVLANNLTVPAYAEQFVNSPNTQYIFRNLFSPTPTYTFYTIFYYDLSGCMISTYGLFSLAVPCIRSDCQFYNYFGPSNPITSPVVGGDLLLPHIATTTNAMLRSASYVANPAFWIFPTPAPFRIGSSRCLVGQILDAGGRVMTSLVNSQLFGSGLFFPTTVNGTAPNPTYLNRLAGFVQLQLGIGYCILNGSSLVTVIQDANGVYEAARGQNQYLFLSTASPKPPAVPGGISAANTTIYFNLTRQYTQLNLVQFNSYFVAKSPPAPPDPFGPAFGNPVDLSSNPIITVLSTPTQQTNLYSVCNLGTQQAPLGTVTYDYSAFDLLSGIADLALVLIDTTTPTFNELQRGYKTAFLLPGSFPIYEYGFYCLNLIMNFLDALGKRTVLQSCFQVSRLSAAVTQLNSFYNNAPLSPYPQYGMPYAGYGSYVTTTMYVGLSPFLILPNPADTLYAPRIQIYRFSPDSFDQAQLVNYDGTLVDVYDNLMGTLDVADLYTIIMSNYNYTVYYIDSSNFNKYTYATINYNGAAWVSTEVVLVSFQVIIPELFASYYGPPESLYIDYNCTNNAVLNLLAENQVHVNITYVEPICPADLGATYMHATGGFCAPVISYQLSAFYNNPSPFNNPCTYFMSYYNVQDPNNAILLYGTQNGVLYAAPPNVPLMAEAIDVMGNVARYYFQLTSDEAPNSTFINFLPPVPLCNGNNVSYVNESYVTQQTAIYTFVIGGIKDIIIDDNGTSVVVHAIYGWEPLNVLALALYNPNSPFFDIPDDCLLLQTMSAYDVFLMCYNQSDVGLCVNCTQLPIPYENTNGTQLIATSEGWWEAYVWRPTTQINPLTGRQYYCRFANSTLVQIPQAMYFTTTNLRRLYINDTQCPGTACFATQLNVFVDPNYSAYQSLVQITSNPPFNSLRDASAVSPPPLDSNSYGVSMGTDYVISLTMDNYFCPVTQVYTPSATGPFILVVRTTHSVCNSPSGTAMFYMVYNNPTLMLGSGYTANVCMYWVGYVNPFFFFHLPVNSANPTAIPFSPDFFVSQNITRFYDVGAGLQTVVVYDACPGAINCPGISKAADCSALINQNTLQVTPSSLNFQIFQFTVDQFSAPGGGLVVSQDNVTLAQCYGDQYDLLYSVYDDQGEPNAVYGPYDWQLFSPFSNDVIAQTPTMCHFYTDPLTGKTTITGGAVLNNPLPIVNFKVYLFDIDTFIPTGDQYGFRPSGNYTLIVRNCAAGCVQTSILYIDMVNPLDIFANTVNSACASQPGSIILSISSGTPYQPGQLYDQTYFPVPNDPNFAVQSLYETYWKTPAHPVSWVRTRLPIQNLPGNYSLMVCDANQCCATVNMSISAPPPIICSVYNIKGACQEQSSTTVQFVCQGGIGPPYYTLQNLTLVQAGQNITFDFVSGFNNTMCFNVMDSVGCVSPQQICFEIPDPGPVPVNVSTVDSCPYQATGSATATSLLGSGYTCQWKSPTVNFPAAQSCTIPNVPANTQLQVIVTNIIGCIGDAYTVVGSRPPLFVVQNFRSTIGGLDSRPCVNYANLTVFGGVYGPNYTVTLVQDTTGAVLYYNNNYSITITDMCRGVQYVIAVSDGDGMCLQTFYSIDPEFDFGSGNQTGIIIPTALPPFQFNEQGGFGGGPTPKPAPAKPQPMLFYQYKVIFSIVIVVGGLIFTVSIVYLYVVYARARAALLAEQKESSKVVYNVAPEQVLEMQYSLMHQEQYKQQQQWYQRPSSVNDQYKKLY